jgi:hypothetical protein
MTFQEHFRAARRVSTPLVAVRTFDAKSTLGQIRKLLGDTLKDTPMILWDIMNGLRALTEKGKDELAHILAKADLMQEATIGDDGLACTLKLAEYAREDAILLISNAHLFMGKAANITQGIWNLRDSYKANGNMLVLLCHPGATLPAELCNDVLMLDEPLPTVAELTATVRDTFKFAKVDAPSDEVIEKAMDALVGLPAFPAEQTTAMCLSVDAKSRKGAIDMPELWGRKRSIISQTSGLSVWEGKERLEDIGGVAVVKEFYKRVIEGRDAPKVIIFMDEIEKAFAGTGTDMSGVKTELTGSMLSWMQDTGIVGSISIGVPGVSKSQLAKSIGGSYGKPVIKFDLAGMQSGIVGSSGANLRAAQKTVDAIKGDGRVLAIATCNSINSLPPELQGRFNLGTFFFDVPTPEEAAAIWDIYRLRYKVADSDVTPAHIGWTGREIEECARKAWSLRLTLQEAAQYIVPVIKSRADSIAHLRQSCSGKYLSASHPGVYEYSGETVQASIPVFSGDSGRKVRA